MTVVAALLVGGLLGACGSSSPEGSADPGTTQLGELDRRGSTEPDGSSTEGGSSTTTSYVVYPCRVAGDSIPPCTEAEVIATLVELYRSSGATAEEAACLAPIYGTGKRAIHETTQAGTPEQDAAAVRCVGSEARVLEIYAQLGLLAVEDPYLGSEPNHS